MNGLSKEAVEKLRVELLKIRGNGCEHFEKTDAGSMAAGMFSGRIDVATEVLELLDAAVAADAPPVACDVCTCGHAAVVHGVHGTCAGRVMPGVFCFCPHFQAA